MKIWMVISFKNNLERSLEPLHIVSGDFELLQ